MLKHFGNLILLKSLQLAGLAAICGSLASADVLYWIEFELDPPAVNVIPGGIASAGFNGVAATSSADFDTKLTSGTWDAVIIAIQGNPFSSFGLLPDLTNYVSGGGKLIGGDWDHDPDFYALFNAAFVDVNNSSVTNDGSSLFNAISGNISITNPSTPTFPTGWGIFDNSMSPLAGGIGIGPSGGGFGIIQGNGGRTFLNGPLFDTYTDPSQGEQLLANELTGGIETPVPEPATLALLLGAFGGLLLVRKSQKQIS
jgi:hypothetical protein